MNSISKHSQRGVLELFADGFLSKQGGNRRGGRREDMRTYVSLGGGMGLSSGGWVGNVVRNDRENSSGSLPGNDGNRPVRGWGEDVLTTSD